MGVEHKHAYRFVFLHSEKWSTVRLEALLREKAKCQICGEESISNDAHHIHYPSSVWNTEESDLVILCRDCHDLTHKIFTLKKSKVDSMKDFLQLVSSIAVWRIQRYGIQHHRRIPIEKEDRLKGHGKDSVRNKSMPCRICESLEKPTTEENMFFKYPETKKKWILSLCSECKILAILKIKWPDNDKQAGGVIRKWIQSEIRRRMAAVKTPA